MELARQLVIEYGYLAVFLGTVLEGEGVLLAAAIAAAHGLLAPPGVAVAGAMGAYTGHLIFFRIGRWKGHDWLFHHRRLGPAAHRADAVLNRYGWAGIFILQYLYGARIAGALLFGLSTFRFPRFALIQVVNCATWATLVTTAGYLLGATLEAASHRLTWISAVVAAALLFLALAVLVVRRLLRDHQKEQGRP